MDMVSENIEILLNDFFKLHDPEKETFLKCFMMMLNESELEVILEALDLKSNIPFNYENDALENIVDSDIKVEDLIDKVLYLAKDERIIFIKFLIIKTKAEEIDFILHILDSRQQLFNEPTEKYDNSIKTKNIPETDSVDDSNMRITDPEIDFMLHILDSRQELFNEPTEKYDNSIKTKNIPETDSVDDSNIRITGSSNDYKENKELALIKTEEDLCSSKSEDIFRTEGENDKKFDIKEDKKGSKEIESLDRKSTGTKIADLKIVLPEKAERMYNAHIDEYQSCPLCSKRIKRVHMTKHTKSGNCVKSLVCDICMKVASTYGNLKKHKKIHTSEYEFMCDFCSKVFYQKQTFNLHVNKIHLKMPSEEKKGSYICSSCPKLFSYKTNLVTHQRVHRERAYLCDLCTKAFHQASNLKAHRRKHTGEKPFPCLVCGKSFSLVGNMKKHMTMCETI